MKINVDELVNVVAEKHKDYLEDNDTPPLAMVLEMEQHKSGKCFPSCFFCKVDKTAAEHILKQL